MSVTYIPLHIWKKPSFSEITRLRDALLASPAIASRKRRMIVVRHLPFGANIGDDESDQFHVFNIVDTCLQYPGGMKELIKIVQEFDRGTKAFENLEDTVVDILIDCVVKKEQRNELLRIMSGIALPDKQLKKLYRESLLSRAQISSEANTLQRVLRHLSIVGQPQGNTFSYPILGFAERLALQIDHKEVRGKIHAWVEDRARELNLSNRELTTLRHRLKHTATLSSSHEKQYLLIDMEAIRKNRHRNAVNKTEYIVRAWHFNGQHKTELPRQREFYTLDDMPQLIEDELLQQIYLNPANSNNNLTIEFLLPNDLICVDVENWAVEDDEPIGFQYPVVVRLRERFRNPKQWSICKQCWRKVDLSQKLSTTSIVYHCTMPIEQWRTLRYNLDPPHISCLALTFVPPRVADSQRDILSIIARTGTPIAIWPRVHATEDAGSVRLELEELLTCGPLEQLPELVRQKRKKAWLSSEHKQPSRRNLTLLWDDPTRIPPQPRYTAPAFLG